MSALSHILAPEPREPEHAPAAPAAAAPLPPEPTSAPMPPTPASPPRTETANERGAETPKIENPNEDDTNASAKKNASGNVPSMYSGNKIKHLKKEDGIPLWRKDIQYDFLRLVFYDQTRCFTKYSDGTKDCTFADVYIDAMAKSSKCSKILKEKLLQDQEGAICMAMVCLLVNVGRMNTTLNFFPEMRAQLRTYHSIPALQAQQDPNAYKQLQDAPRLKSILKGATEDEPQPSTMEEIQAAKMPRTNAVNLIFILSQYAPKVSEVHFQPPRDFFDLIMRGSLSSASRAKAFLWLLWWYLESDFSQSDSQRNPFGPGIFGEGEEGTGVLPLRVPTLESLTEEQAALENVDTDEEKHFGEVKRKERIAILASEPSPAMTALKRARQEKGLTTGHLQHSDDEASEAGWYRGSESRMNATSAGRAGSDYTRSPSPSGSRSFQSANGHSKSGGNMGIHDLLNNEERPLDSSPPAAVMVPPVKKGPGRGNWRRNKPKVEGSGSHHVPLLPNTGQLSFVSDGPPATPGSAAGYSHGSPQQSVTGSARDHVPTPSYQAQKRHRGITQHQSAVINHRKQQIDYNLDVRVRKMHERARERRETQGAMIRAWKRIRMTPIDYDTEDEFGRVRRAKHRIDREEDGRGHRSKETAESLEELESLRRSRVLLAGLMRFNNEPIDVGEEARNLTKTFDRAKRRLKRWQGSTAPGEMVLRRIQRENDGLIPSLTEPRPPKRTLAEIEHDDMVEMANANRPPARPTKRVGRKGGRPPKNKAIVAKQEEQPEPDMENDDDDDGGGELDDEERELLGEVDNDDSEGEDEDEEMADD